MFTSRVLPPPPALTRDSSLVTTATTTTAAATSSHASLRTPKPDALLEHRIMMPYEHHGDKSALSSTATLQSPRLFRRISEDRPSPLVDAAADINSSSTATNNNVINDDREEERSYSSGTAATKRKRAPSGSRHQGQHSNQEGRLPAVGLRDGLPAVTQAGAGGTTAAVAALPTKPVDSPSQICLCQPDPKVPRPRNAFILYRQHHQAKVVAENPGLANPEISKIIGDLWRQSPPDVKQHWKNLAEEEKLRHQRQYPDYRYQPKRGRNSVPTAIPPGQGSPRCLKCGGKSMATPHLPSPGFRSANTTNGAIRADTPMSPYSATGMMPRTPYGIPPGYVMSPGGHPAYMPRAGPTVPAGRPAERSPGLESPEAKRRRYEAVGPRYVPRGAGPMSAIPMTPVEQLPRPEFLKPGSASFVMGPAPPARPHNPHQHQQNHGIGHGHSLSQGSARNEDLRLAPLQINKGLSDASQGQAKSVEAMVMSIKPLAKIKTLAKISAPLQRPGPTSPPRPLRGAVVAVEGTDFEAMEAVGQHVRADLERRGEHVVRAWESPQLEYYDDRERPALLDVLQLMTHWHGISSEVVKFITRVPEDPADEPSSPVSPLTKWTKPVEKDGGDYWSNGNVEDGVVSISSRKTSPDSHNNSRSGGERCRTPMPVALIPNYQLTTTDVAASIIPIADYYSPIDHWQWVAALWRGTVGPDVIVCVRGPDDVVDSGSSPKEGGHRGSMSSAKSVSKGGVDVRLEEARTVIVRCERRGEVSEQVLRRVAFEVGEWVRSREERRDER